MREMKLQDLKSKTPAELLSFAEEHQVENASTMRKQELMFAILKQLAQKEIDIIGEGVVTALVILTIRWRSTASLNLKECSSSASVSLSHSMFMST